MRREHLEAFAPVCPVCRGKDRLSRIVLSDVFEEAAGHVIQGILRCPESGCEREYPIIDGIPLIVSAIRETLTHQAFALLQRDDLAPDMESLIGDCLGSGSAFDLLRQHVSTYAADHWGDLDPEAPSGGSVVRVMNAGLALAGSLPRGPAIDIGCSVGRTTFELAARTNELVLGIDLNIGMLRVAAHALRRGKVRYARRRVGLVFDRREFKVRLGTAGRVDFWACDATALPFADAAAPLALSLHVIDVLADPWGHLRELRRILRPGGFAILATPYDWTTAATPVESWIGGHSQRGETLGASEPRLRALLTPEHTGLQIVAEREDVPWDVRLHARGTMRYSTHVVVVRAAT